MEVLKNQQCPFCGKKELCLTEDNIEVPYFGRVFIFSMRCDACDVNQSDVEAEQPKDPCKITFTIEDEKDLSVRVVKSSNATIRIPQMRMSVEAGEASEGYVSNVEGLLNRFEKIIEEQRDTAEEDSEKKTAKNLLKKLRKVKFGDVELKIIIEDPTGNSAIISEKASIEKLKVKK
jgi:zinc finger protein